MRIKGKVSHIFHSMESGFKIIALEISKNSAIPEKYRNPDFPFSVSVVGNLKLAQEEYVVRLQENGSAEKTADTGHGNSRLTAILCVI